MVGPAHPDLFTLALLESERATAARRDASYSSWVSLKVVAGDGSAPSGRNGCAFRGLAL